MVYYSPMEAPGCGSTPHPLVAVDRSAAYGVGQLPAKDPKTRTTTKLLPGLW